MVWFKRFVPLIEVVTLPLAHFTPKLAFTMVYESLKPLKLEPKTSVQKALSGVVDGGAAKMANRPDR
jgi:hypothetical protein